MKRRRIILIFIGLMLTFFILKGTIYRNLIHYKSIGQRKIEIKINTQLSNFLNDLPAIENPTVEKIISVSLIQTSDQLNYTFGSCAVDPSKIVLSHSTNCIGYAALYTLVCNYYLNKYGLNNQWKATHQYGKQYLFKYNINKLINHKFFKDHDFVIIQQLNNGQKYAVDPTLHDYSGIEIISLLKNNDTSDKILKKNYL